MPKAFVIKDGGDLKLLNKALRQQADGKQLRKELTSAFRAVLRPIAREVQAAYRAAPSEGHDTASHGRRDQPDLRQLLAKATKVEVRLSGKQAGARIRVDGRRMPDRMKSLPAYWEGEGGPRGGASRWRHPVYGDRDTWVQQPSRPTATPIFAKAEKPAHREVEQVLNGMRLKLEGNR